MIESETARWPKLLLATWRAVMARNADELMESSGRCVQFHRKKATWKGSGVADRIVAPELCFLTGQARARGLSFTLPALISDWVIDAPD
jgi:hypothetical protein